MTGSRIIAVGRALPDGTLSNAELGEHLSVDETWIEERTGIRERRIAGATDTASSLGATAASRALEAARLTAEDVDLVICATVTPDWDFPATACLVQHALGIEAPAFDLNAGCSGFLFALAQADANIRAGAARNVLVVGCEVLSRITDPDDPKTVILFGDGAGAAVVVPGEPALGPFRLFADGARPELLHVKRENGKIHMEGREVYRAAVLGMADAAARTLGAAGLHTDEVDLVIAHQANARILDGVAQRLDLPAAKMYSNIARYGNTSAASIPIALHDAQLEGRLKDGDLVVLAAFGAGFTWGAGIVRWSTSAKPERVLVGASSADA